MKLFALLPLLVLTTSKLGTTSPTPISIHIEVSSIRNVDGNQNRRKAKKCSDTCPELANSTQSDAYVCGDPRLGPIQLPTDLPLCELTATYDRFGGLSPEAFLAKWTVNGSYVYPPANGFLLSILRAPIMGNITLNVGEKIDRFGSEYGKFTSPAKAPYSERSLPPSNLDTPVDADGKPGKYPFNYHIYEVKKEFIVLAGPVAPWFSQPGLGTQFKMSGSVMSFIDTGFLKRIDPNDACRP